MKHFIRSTRFNFKRKSPFKAIKETKFPAFSDPQMVIIFIIQVACSWQLAETRSKLKAKGYCL